MNKFALKQHIPALAVGFLGALVFQVLIMVIGIGVVSSSKIRSEFREKLQNVVNQAVTEKNLTDSAGQHSDVIDVVDAVNPAVVSIVVTKDVPKMEQIINQGGQQQNNPFGMFGFNMMQPQYQQNGTEKKEVGGGSGFIVTDDGYIVTNAHVVSDATAEYTVFLNDEKKYDATIVASDSILDIAVLKIDGTDLPYLEFGDSDTVKVGQTVIAIGNSLGQFRNTVSVGVISGLARSIVAGSQNGTELLSDVLQTDAAINPGNSGGPLLDLSGRVIGVNVATSSGGENVSFSLPSNTVNATVDSIRKNGKIVAAYLGVRFEMITADLVSANSLSVEEGALITRSQDGKQLAVVPGSPADKAGIEENDIITKVDETVLDNNHPLNVVLRQKAVGDTIMLTVMHDGKEKTVSVTLVERPEDKTTTTPATKK